MAAESRPRPRLVEDQDVADQAPTGSSLVGRLVRSPGSTYDDHLVGCPVEDLEAACVGLGHEVGENGLGSESTTGCLDDSVVEEVSHYIVDEAIGLVDGPLQGLLTDGHVPSGRDVQHHRHSSPVAAEGDEVDPARPIDCGVGLEQPEVQDEDARGAGGVGHWPRAGRSGMGGKFSRATLEPCRPIQVDAHGVRVHRQPTPESHPRR